MQWMMTEKVSPVIHPCCTVEGARAPFVVIPGTLILSCRVPSLLKHQAEQGAYECTSTLAAGCAALALQDFRARAELDMEAAAQGIPATVQVLVLHGTNDATIPYQVSAVVLLHLISGCPQFLKVAEPNKKIDLSNSSY